MAAAVKAKQAAKDDAIESAYITRHAGGATAPKGPASVFVIDPKRDSGAPSEADMRRAFTLCGVYANGNPGSHLACLQAQLGDDWGLNAFVELAPQEYEPRDSDALIAPATALVFVAGLLFGSPPGPTALMRAQQLVDEGTPILTALSKTDAYHRAPAFVTGQIAKSATVWSLSSARGVVTLVQMPGEVNGVAGRFEWIVDQAGKITHMLFVEGGKITGVPTIP